MRTDPNGEIFLHPGDYFFGEGGRIGTVLGSCVAISLWHPRLHIGGMCHFMLPRGHGKEAKLNGKYAVDAMEMFKESARKHNTKIQEYQAKIFGGSNPIPELAKNETIGMRNAAVAMELLMAQHVDILAADVGETWSRRIVFDLANGDVWVKYNKAPTVDLTNPSV